MDLFNRIGDRRRPLSDLEIMEYKHQASQPIRPGLPLDIHTLTVNEIIRRNLRKLLEDCVVYQACTSPDSDQLPFVALESLRCLQLGKVGTVVNDRLTQSLMHTMLDVNVYFIYCTDTWHFVHKHYPSRVFDAEMELEMYYSHITFYDKFAIAYKPAIIHDSTVRRYSPPTP